MRSALLALMLALVESYAWSNDPIPTPTHKTGPPQKQAKRQNNPASADQRGTEIQPLFVRVVDPPKTDSQPSKNQEKSGDKPPFIWGMTAEEATAIFTLALVVVGAVTAALLLWQSVLLRRTVALAREEFVASHRPQIIARNPTLDGDQILYSLVNVGGTKAIIVESWIFSEWVTADINPRNLRPAGHDCLGRRELMPGEFIDATYPEKIVATLQARATYAANRRLHNDNNPSPIPADAVFHFAGAITYRDVNGRNRQSVFRRKYDFTAKCFVRTGDPDHEYCD